jgi:hypothetical protein
MADDMMRPNPKSAEPPSGRRAEPIRLMALVGREESSRLSVGEAGATAFWNGFGDCWLFLWSALDDDAVPLFEKPDRLRVRCWAEVGEIPAWKPRVSFLAAVDDLGLRSDILKAAKEEDPGEQILCSD